MDLFRREFLILCLALVTILTLSQVSQISLNMDVSVASHKAVDSNLSMGDIYHSQAEGALLDSSLRQSTSVLQQDQLEFRTYLPFMMWVRGSITYYVSKTGNNGNGTSWATAWNELDQINWEVVQPGDTILLDGGSSQMVYNSTLTIGKSGTSDKPITIKLTSEAGRNGQAVIFGGRPTPLPYCAQPTYNFETEGVRDMGILIESYSWVIIDGTKWRGITIYGHNRYGIELYDNASNITVRNVEIYDNGTAIQHNGQWGSDLPGINLGGTNITFERAIIHDNGQDAFQWGHTISNFTLRQSWLYNSRRHPIYVNEAFNYCTHSDGIQIYNGGSQSGFLIEETIIGPGFSNGVLLGQALIPPGIQATTHDVTFRNVLFTKATDNNLAGYAQTKPERWVIDHVTLHCPNTKYQCLYFEGSGHTVRDSIIHGAAITLPDGLDSFSGNCQWNTQGFQLGQIADPLFVDVNEGDPFSLDNYALLPHSPCPGKGSSITSVAQLLGQPDPDRLISGLLWEAEEGYVSAPFMISNSYIVQPIETNDPALSGSASYRFNITTSGNYVIKALVDAPGAESNSVFINIDGEPSDPGMIWDIEITAGFQERAASWRGSGTEDANEFVPKVFSLPAGEHELIIKGRERNIRLDWIKVEDP